MIKISITKKGLLHIEEKFYVMYRKLIKAQINVLEVNEKTANLKPYSIIENNSKYFILKGSDFLIKVKK